MAASLLLRRSRRFEWMTESGRQLLVLICKQCRSERQLSAIAPLIPVSPFRLNCSHVE
jgi:hypothetical protein